MQIRAGNSGVNPHDIPVIALTAAVLQSYRDQAIQAGMTAYLSKPVDPRQLMSLLLQ